MSKERLDYQKLCPNHYSNYEDGCCMESCEIYNHDECPVVYVNELISDLEAKLAESEKNFIVANNLRKKSDEVLLNYKTEKYGLDKTIQELRKIKLSMPEKEWYYKGFENCERQMSSHISDLTLEVKELKQQLAEKDKEIEKLKTTNDRLYKKNKKLENQIVESNIRFYKKGALEQLEKVKELCKKKFDWWENSEWEGDIYDKSDVSNAYFDIEANIGNQIEQLKEMK